MCLSSRCSVESHRRSPRHMWGQASTRGGDLHVKTFVRGTRSYVVLGSVAAFVVLLLVGALPAAANTAPQTLPFGQKWTDTAAISAANDWSGVPGIIGYRGDAMVGATGVDPQTVLADGSATPVNVLANQTSPNTLTTGGIAEFDTLADPVVALQGSGTARAPH